MAEVSTTSTPTTSKRQMTARALLLGERIDVAGLERSDVISTTPLAFRAGHEGYAVLFRYGALVLFGLSVVEEDELVRGLKPRIVGAYSRPEVEGVSIEITPDRDDHSLLAARSRRATFRRPVFSSSPTYSARTWRCRTTNARSPR